MTDKKLKPEPQTLYSTGSSLSSVVEQASSQLPITSRNRLVTVLMTYHNTLLAALKELNEEKDSHDG